MSQSRNGRKPAHRRVRLGPSGGLKCQQGWAEIKRMWIAGHLRGIGLGRRILEFLEGLARKRRLGVIKLETNKSLKEAQELYKSSGYRDVPPFNDEPYAHHWFAKQLKSVS